MSDFGPVVLALAIQVTVPVVAGLILSRRRDPAAACGPLVIAAIAVLVLTPLAFAPRPGWSAEPRPAEPGIAPPVADPPPPAAAGTPGGINVLELLRLAKPAPTVAGAPAFDPWRFVALCGAGLAGVGALRLGLGCLSTWRVVRASKPVHDAGVLALADELRQSVGCRRPVAVRESSRAGSAAVAGWLRPVVLLSPGWRLWTPAERRAALAHELAHVARRDFATRLLARLAVALYAYHPLVRWLAARLELHQELAADARAAAVCAGRMDYAKCLAGLALKADARPLGLSPTFLSCPKTLFTRITMLRVTDDTVSHSRRWPLVAVALSAAAVLGLHGAKPQAVAGPVERARFSEKKELPPLDASYVLPSDDPNVCGVFAVRLGDVLRAPGMDKVGESYGELLKSAFEGKKPRFELTDVEQVSGRVSLSHDPKKPAPNRSLMLSLTSIRMAKDFDWARQLQDWTADWKEHTHAGATLYSAKITLTALGFKDASMWFYLPDARTVVLESESNVKKLIDLKGKLPATPWADEWTAVAGSTMAFAIPDLKPVATKLPDKPEGGITAEVLKPLTAVLGKASRMTVGVDLSEGCAINVRLACASADDAIAVDEGCQTLAKLAEAVLGDEANGDAVAAGKRFSAFLVRGVDFSKSADHIVEVRMKSKMGLGELLNTAARAK